MKPTKSLFRRFADLKKWTSSGPMYHTMRGLVFMPDVRLRVQRPNCIFHYVVHTYGDWTKPLRVEKYRWQFNIPRVKRTRNRRRRRPFNERYYAGKYDTLSDRNFYESMEQKCFTELPPPDTDKDD